MFTKSLDWVALNCWFSHDVTKIQTTKLSILLRFYFHGVLEQLKTNFQTNFRFKRALGFIIEYAWISKLLLDAAFTWRTREVSFRLKKWLFSGNLLPLCKIYRYVWYVFSEVHIMLSPNQKPSTIKNKIANHSIQKVPNLGNKRR